MNLSKNQNFLSNNRMSSYSSSRMKQESKSPELGSTQKLVDKLESVGRLVKEATNSNLDKLKKVDEETQSQRTIHEEELWQDHLRLS